MADPTPPGLQAIFAEMERQPADAVRSFEQSGAAAVDVADSMRRTGRVLLLGMGGSHAVNRTAEVFYRQAGLDATALPVSEALYGPFPGGRRTVLLVSQSGESAEIARFLGTASPGEERFGLTLNGESTLARAVPSLVGHGGAEHAFAATRSLTITFALHARVLHELGAAQESAILAAQKLAPASIQAAADVLAAKKAVVFSGRAAMQGIAEAGALGLAELARIPCFALEGGQLRHGPVEALRPDLGVVLIRSPDSAPELTRSIAELCSDAGCEPVILDASGHDPLPRTVTVSLPRAEGLAAAFTVLPALQALMIEVARRLVPDVGRPLRSSKVTRIE